MKNGSPISIRDSSNRCSHLIVVQHWMLKFENITIVIPRLNAYTLFNIFLFIYCRRFSHVWHVFANGIKVDRIVFAIVGHHFWNHAWIVRFPAIFHFILMKYVSKHSDHTHTYKTYFMRIRLQPRHAITNTFSMECSRIQRTTNIYIMKVAAALMH